MKRFFFVSNRLIAISNIAVIEFPQKEANAKYYLLHLYKGDDVFLSEKQFQELDSVAVLSCRTVDLSEK